MVIDSINCDVLVIGCGAAGIRAAIESNDQGADVIIVNKIEKGHSGSTFYPLSMPWGIMSAGNNEKDQQEFLNEILKASCGCLNKKLTEVLVRESYDRFLELCGYGIKFRLLSDSNERPCFGNRPRGAQLISLDNARSCLMSQLAKRGIQALDGFYIFDIIVEGNTCFGALGVDDQGNLQAIYSKATIIATGGSEYLWECSLASPDTTGDGYAMAAKHGARLMNMEFIQFIPGTVSPVKKINFHHPTLASIPEIMNSRGKEFLYKYLPQGISIEQCLTERAGHGPFSCEDNSKYFDIAICSEGSEIKNGEAPGAEVVYTDFFYKDDRYVLWREFLFSNRINTEKENIKIFPHCQGFNGGIVIDENCSTDIDNLYACGECAGGPHGANRIGGNAILATQVFGKIAGQRAAARAKQVSKLKDSVDYMSYLHDNFDSGIVSGILPDDVIIGIKTIMQKCACIIREENILKDGLNSIEQMFKNYNCCQYIDCGKRLKKAFSAYNSLITARIILNSMIIRKESRGSHYRDDFPKKYGSQFSTANYFRMSNNRAILHVNE